MTTRRRFLKTTGILGAAAAAGMLPGGEAAADALGGPYKILELFAYGALSHRDTLWVDGEVDNAVIGRASPDMAGSGIPGVEETLFLSPEDEAGHDYELYLGAGVAPLIDLNALNKTRLVAMSADVPDAHLLGAAYALRGAAIGNPAGMSLGARIQHNEGPTPAPASWVIDAGRTPATALAAADHGGLPGYARPFVLKMGSDVMNALDRGSRADQDPLLDLFRRRYKERLDGTRSAGFSEYDSTVSSALDWEATRAMLSQCHSGCGEIAVPPTIDDPTPGDGNPVNGKFLEGITVAGNLLKAGARHVAVVENDAILDTHALTGYTHQLHSTHHNLWLWHVLDRLFFEVALGRISLHDTMVVLHAEFGRRLDKENGSEHHRSAYAALLVGGPIKGPTCCGTIAFDDNPDGLAIDGATAPELLNAVAMAAGAPTPGVPQATVANAVHKVIGI